MRLIAAITMCGMFTFSMFAERASAQAAPPQQKSSPKQIDASKLLTQVLDAYKSTQKYHAIIRYSVEQRMIRRVIRRQDDVRIAFDRESQVLMIDRPEYRIVLREGSRLFSHTELKNRYLVTDDIKASSAELKRGLSVGRNDVLPEVDIAFLLDAEPLKALGAHGMKLVAPDENTLVIRTPATTVWLFSTLTLRVDPKTKLLKQVVRTFRPRNATQGISAVAVTYDIDVKQHNAELPENVFVFNESGVRFSDWQKYVSADDALPATDMIGQAAPAFELPLADGRKMKLSDVEHDIVVLQFWASWSDPCRRGLIQLQQLNSWAQKSGNDVSVVTINLAEPATMAKTYVKALGVDFPVLLDADSKVSELYQVRSIPHTVVIRDNRVVAVTVGYREDHMTKLKEVLADDDVTGK